MKALFFATIIFTSITLWAEADWWDKQNDFSQAGNLFVAKSSSVCLDGQTALKISGGLLACVKRESLPDEVLSELQEMKSRESDDSIAIDYRITRLELLTGFSAPENLIDDLFFLRQLVLAFSFPGFVLQPENVEYFTATEPGEFLNIPNGLFYNSEFQDLEASNLGRYLLDTIKDWRGQHLVFVNEKMMQEKVLNVEYHFLFYGDQILFFEHTWFEN